MHTQAMSRQTVSTLQDPKHLADAPTKAACNATGSDIMAKEFGALVYRARSVLDRLTAANNRLTGASPVRESLGDSTVSDSFASRMWATLSEIKNVFDAIDDETQKLENFA